MPGPVITLICGDSIPYVSRPPHKATVNKTMWCVVIARHVVCRLAVSQALFYMLFHEPPQNNVIILPVLVMRKLRQRDVRKIVQSDSR